MHRFYDNIPAIEDEYVREMMELYARQYERQEIIRELRAHQVYLKEKNKIIERLLALQQIEWAKKLRRDPRTNFRPTPYRRH